jgi:hypothetical protein
MTAKTFESNGAMTAHAITSLAPLTHVHVHVGARVA